MGVGQGCPEPWRPPGPVLSTALHAEPYIMFSTDKKSLLCIRCFRDMQGWVKREVRVRGGLVCQRGVSPRATGSPQGKSGALRGPGVGLCARMRETGAGGVGECGWVARTGQVGGTGHGTAPTLLRLPCRQAVKALQTATREAIALLQAMVEEVRCSAAEEEAAIHALFGSMQVRGTAGQGRGGTNTARERVAGTSKARERVSGTSTARERAMGWLLLSKARTRIGGPL